MGCTASSAVKQPTKAAPQPRKEVAASEPVKIAPVPATPTPQETTHSINASGQPSHAVSEKSPPTLNATASSAHISPAVPRESEKSSTSALSPQAGSEVGTPKPVSPSRLPPLDLESRSSPRSPRKPRPKTAEKRARRAQRARDTKTREERREHFQRAGIERFRDAVRRVQNNPGLLQKLRQSQVASQAASQTDLTAGEFSLDALEPEVDEGPIPTMEEYLERLRSTKPVVA
eukprot:m.137559 g.137559  ORF g.137559 m.137559 type:complete len:232 (+) comp9573_c0_seq2:76-771(+)